MSNFQIIVVGIFVFFGIMGMVLFATFKGGVGTEQTVGSVVIWGTIKNDVMSQILNDLSSEDSVYSEVKYIEKDAKNFDQELVEALASGEGPDIFLFPHDLILKNQGKAYLIPYEVFPARDFKDSFIPEGELFLSAEGVIALPFIVDPMVMYWNRSIFNNSGIALPPKLWDEFILLSQKMTKKDQNMNILQSAVALGEFRNIYHAKEIISTLVMQTGDPITQRIDVDGKDKITTLLGGGDRKTNISSAEMAVRFFTEFSDPVKSVYSWNRSLARSDERFLAGDLAIYFGFASELDMLKSKNPNLDFDVAPIPQTKESVEKITYGKMQGLAVSKNSKNISGAVNVAKVLSSTNWQSTLSNKIKLPPVRRDLLTKKPADPYQSVFYEAALSAKGWLDPDTQETSVIFQNMVESVTSGRVKISEAVSRASAEIAGLLE